MSNILVIADPHINSLVGLCKSNMNREGWVCSPTPTNRWLDKCWNSLLKTVETIPNLTTILDGDAVEGDTKARTHALLTTSTSEMIKMAGEVLDPLRQMSKNFYMVSGTPAHTGIDCELEELLAMRLQVTRPRGCTTLVPIYLPLVANKVTFDIAHFAPMGAYPAKAACLLAERTMHEYAKRKMLPPDIVIRAHQHRFADSYDNYPTRGMFCAGFTTKTNYIHSKNPITLADVGAYLYECSEGEYTCKVIRFDPPAPTVEVLHDNN